MGLYQGIGWVIWKFSDGPVTTSTMKEDKIAAKTLHSNTMQCNEAKSKEQGHHFHFEPGYSMTLHIEYFVLDTSVSRH